MEEEDEEAHFNLRVELTERIHSNCRYYFENLKRLREETRKPIQIRANQCKQSIPGHRRVVFLVFFIFPTTSLEIDFLHLSFQSMS